MSAERALEGGIHMQDCADSAMGEAPGQWLAQFIERLEASQRQIGRLEGRLESMEIAESNLRQQLERERQRADRLEVERDRLVPDLLRERDRANAERERAEHFEAELREALEARRGWFRRFFGF